MKTNPIRTIQDLCDLDADIPLFLYGAGDTAERVYRLLEKVKVRVTGFCVSGNPPQNERLFGKEVLAHATLQNQYGEYRILIATCMVHMQQIMEILEERQEDNLVCFFEDFERFLELYTIHEMKSKSFPDLSYGDMPYMQLTSYIAAMNEDEMKQAQYRVVDQAKPLLDHELMYRMLVDIKNNASEYQAIYNLLEDDLSKQVLRNIALGCLYQNRKPFADAFRLNSFPDGVGYGNAQYFCDDIFHMTDQEVFVQCGGLDGATALMFILKYKKYKKIYVYEPVPKQFEITEKNLSKFDHVIVKQNGVYDQSAILKLSESTPGLNRINQNDGIEVQTVRLDDDIKEPITFIAMDIEGAEVAALRGARKHIETTLPKLAICVYHTPEALREIFGLIRECSQKYKFYLRHHMINNAETVLYAV